MKSFNNYIFFSLIILKLVQLNDCSAAHVSDVRELERRFFGWRLHESPEYGTKVGHHALDDLVEEFTEEAFSRQLSNATSLLRELDSVDTSKLTDTDKVSIQIMKYNILTFIDGYQYRKYGMYNAITPMERPTDDWEAFVTRMKFNTETDYMTYLSRLNKFPTQIDQRIMLMRAAIMSNTTVHNVSLTGAVESLDRLIVFNATQSIFYRPFNNIPSSISLHNRTALQSEGQSVITNKIVPTLRRLRHFVIDEYQPSTRSNVSMSSLPGGAEYYRACLRWHTSLDWSPERIHAIGQREVARILVLMEQIKAQQGFSGSLKQFIEHLNSQPENFYHSEAAMLAGYSAIVKEIKTKLPKILLRITNSTLIVKKATNPETSTGRYNEPPLDKSRPAEFVVPVSLPETRPKYDMMSLTLHEAEPGHHTQFTYAKEDLPDFRKALEYRKYNAVPFNWPFHTGYVEGWALYAESLGEAIQAYDTLSLFGRYSSELFRSCRLVVDTGIHAFGWSKEMAVEYLMNHTTQSLKNINNEVNRYISWPGQACSYKVGELKIKELRQRAEASLGRRFDVRLFHHEVLKLGPAPLSILEHTISDWIAYTNAANQITAARIVILLPLVVLNIIILC